jgi:hypothetical protein
MNQQKYCDHVYKNMNAKICPLCGKETRETNWPEQWELHKEWISSGKATSQGWWSI